MIRTSAVYKITCTATGRVYVGSSVDAHTRYRSHMSMLKKGWHDNRAMRADFKKHGAKAFVFDILEECHVAELDEREKLYITRLKRRKGVTLYNAKAIFARNRELPKTQSLVFMYVASDLYDLAHDYAKDLQAETGINQSPNQILKVLLYAGYKSKTGKDYKPKGRG